jgi:hypothetical protein
MLVDVSLENYRGKNPEREIEKLHFPELLLETWMKTATLRVAVAGFESTRMYPLNPDVQSEKI